MCHMAHHVPHPPLPTGFRRRFPLELSPDEYQRLEDAARPAGSKRAALLLGLAALAETHEHQAALARAEGELGAARDEIAALTKSLAKAQLARSHADAAAERSAATDRDAAQESEEMLTEARKRVGRLEQSLHSERRSHEDTLDEVHALRAQVVDELHCPRCGTFAGHTDWATQRAKDGALVYHKPCGYHRGGLLEATSVLGRRMTG